MADHEIAASAAKNRVDFLVNYRWILVSIVAILTIILSILIPNIKVDPTLKSVLVTSSPSFNEYQKFRDFFDDDEYVVIAIKPTIPIDDPKMLASVNMITDKLGQVDRIVEALSLTNLKVYQKRGEKLSNQLLVAKENNEFIFPEQATFQKVRKALPIVDLLLSKDQKTIGILVRIHEDWKFDHKANKEILSKIKDIVKSNLPKDSDYRIVGQAELRQAILKYTLKTALIFGILCTLICLTVTGYVFRNVTVTAVTMGILGLCVLWVLELWPSWGSR